MRQGILLIDDNEDFGLVTSEMLRAAGHIVTYVSTGEAAFNCLRSGYLPHLILLDWRLRGGFDGSDFIGAIKRAPLLSQVPVIIISGERPLDIPWLAFAPKPIDDVDLLSMIRRYAR